MSYHDSIRAMDLKLFNVFGVLGSYKFNSDNSIVSNLKFILDESIELVSDGGYGEISKKLNVIYIKRSDVDNPNYLDVITIGSKNYQVEEELNRDNLLTTVSVKLL